MEVTRSAASTSPALLRSGTARSPSTSRAGPACRATQTLVTMSTT
jgi:hypothetical protein